jgi:hypothetical protein
MALLYPWASKEYCLWEMSLGQLIFYNNTGLEMKFGKDELKPRSAAEMTAKEIHKITEEVASWNLDEVKGRYGA